MSDQRPKSPSPNRLPAVSDTVVGLDPVPEGPQVPAPEPRATTVDRPGRETTAPIEIPEQLRAKIDPTTTPATALADVAPGLAAQLGAAPDFTPVNPYPAITPKDPAPAVTPVDPAPALTPKEPAPAAEDVPFDERTFRQPPAHVANEAPRKKPATPPQGHPPAPRKSRIDVPALSADGTPTVRKSRTDVPALNADGTPRRSHGENGDGAPVRKSRIDAPILNADGTPRKSRTDVPAQAGGAPAPRKSRLDVPAQTAAAPAGGTTQVGPPPRKSRIDVPAPLAGVTEPQSASEPPSDAAEVPTDSRLVPLPEKGLSGDTVVKTLPQVPPVRPFKGIDDPRVKQAAMIAGIIGAVVFLSFLSWELLKHEPPPPPAEPLRPAFVEMPAPPRHEEPDDPAPAPAPQKQALQIEVQVDAGMGETKTVLVPAGVMHIYCDPEADAWVDGRDLGPQPVRAVLPAGKVVVTLINPKIGLHKAVGLEVKADEERNASFHFFPGWIEVVAPDDAKVTIDGKPAKEHTAKVWEGLHRVEATFGHQKVSRTAEVVAGETTSIELHQP